jgi:hypothetical protein
LGLLGVHAAGVFEHGVGDVDLESVKLAAKGAGGMDKLRDGEALDFAVSDPGGQLLVNRFEVSGEAFELSGLNAEDAFFGFFEPEEPKFVDARPCALIPLIESGSRHADRLRDFGNRKALDPEFDELLYEICVVHIVYLFSVFGFSLAGGVGQRLSDPKILISDCRSGAFEATGLKFAEIKYK